MSEYKELIDIEIDEKSERIIELENNPEFQKLSYSQKIILLTGEKLLQLDQKLRQQTQNVNNFINGYSGAITDIVQNQKNINVFIKDIIKKEILDISNKFQMGEGLGTIEEEKIIHLIEEKYNDEISNMESRFQHLAEETIKSLDDSVFDTLEKIDSLKQFEIKAREQIQKNEDKIYLLEEEIARQKEINEDLKNGNYVLKNLSQENLSNINESQINNYQYYDSRFNSIEELEEFIKEEAKKIAKVEVEKYVHDYNLFSDDRSDELIDKLFEEGQIKESEISKMYKLQMDNNTKMNELEYLLDEQNRQIKMLSEDRQKLVSTLSDILENKDVDLSNVFKSIELNEINSDLNYKSNDNNLDSSEILNKDEMEILVKKQAIELVKEKINYLNHQKALKQINDIERSNSLNDEKEEKFKEYFDETNKKIKELEAQLEYQLKENNNLKNDLFDEMSKNGSSIEDEIIEDFSIENDDDIIGEMEILNLDEITEEELMKQHNYYSGSTPIPGTKITRINNYKINNDINSSNFSDDAQYLIKKDVEKFSVKAEEEKVNYIEPKDAVWQANNQKIVDLETLINRQEEEIKRLKDNKPTIIETTKVVENNNYQQNETLNSIDESIKSALNKLQDLAFAQENTKREIEETNRKIIELETQLKRNSKNNNYEDELARIELDKILEEKYKMNSKAQDESYSEEIKKIELERKKIEETLELERIRLLSEIEANRKRLNETPIEEPKPVVVEQPVQVQNVAPEIPKKEEPKKEDVKFVMETPKKKRKQQVFFEVKIHSTPKLTRADIEK